jgi:small subunit ribosomal protein S16
MAVKIRLQRFGKRNQSFFHIVAADSRAPRDGKFIEKLGIYNPRTNPATVELDTDKALKWLDHGAQASDTCRAILSYRGVMFRKHLQEGVRKNAITQEDADQRFNAWLEQKNLKISQKAQDVANQRKEDQKKRLAEEGKVREKVAEKVSARKLAVTEALEASARQAVADATAGAETGADDAETATASTETPEAPETPETPEAPAAGSEGESEKPE